MGRADPDRACSADRLPGLVPGASSGIRRDRSRPRSTDRRSRRGRRSRRSPRSRDSRIRPGRPRSDPRRSGRRSCRRPCRSRRRRRRPGSCSRRPAGRSRRGTRGHRRIRGRSRRNAGRPRATRPHKGSPSRWARSRRKSGGLDSETGGGTAWRDLAAGIDDPSIDQPPLPFHEALHTAPRFGRGRRRSLHESALARRAGSPR